MVLNDSLHLAKIQKVDDEHVQRLKEIIKYHAWFNKNLVGKDSAHTAWLLV